jgi:tetratricopeptide (TPR) repeat protein
METLSRLLDEADSLTEAGQFSEAAKVCESILAGAPDHPGALRRLGASRGRLGRLDEAVVLLRRALERDPNQADAHDQLGCVLHTMGRHSEAIACFDRAIAIDPEHVEAFYNRAIALRASHRDQEAAASLEAAVRLEPEFAAAHFELGAIRQALGQPDAAIAHYRQAVAAEPDYARAHTALGAELQRHGQHAAAVASYERAVAIDQDNADLHDRLGLALQGARRHDRAIAHHQRAIGLRPDLAGPRNNLALALQALNRHEEAIAAYRTAIAIGPPHALRHANLGMALREIGRLDEAASAFDAAIVLAPRNGRFWRALADCRRFFAGDPAFAAMEALATGGSALPEDERRQLLFALAKAYGDAGEPAKAFRHMLEGNEMQRRRIGYDETAELDRFARIEAAFSRDLFRLRAGQGDPSALPVFIVGMPRSGTTLIEQILASHPDVFGAGELTDIDDAFAQLMGGGVLPESVAALPAEAFRQLGTAYAESARARAPSTRRVTDKMPLNFRYVGLIHLALPNARIIHAVRDPVDTCLSCFATMFPGEHRMAYGLRELGHYYRAYERLMAHWRQVLPDGVMLEVRYEEVVDDLAGQARRIVAHCGLGWDDACLAFHQAAAPVRTASAAQVRRPIYRSSVGRSRDHGELLLPLLEALGAARSGG